MKGEGEELVVLFFVLIISKSHKNYYGTRKYFVARELNPNVKINRHETKIFFFSD